jgi:hypothetical protein
MKPGDKVGAITGTDGVTLEVYGLGTYEGEFDIGDGTHTNDAVGAVAEMIRSVPEYQRPKNPRIHLDNEDVICWWGSPETYQK